MFSLRIAGNSRKKTRSKPHHVLATQYLIGRIKILFRIGRICNHRLWAGLPVGRAHFTMFVSKLERLHQTQSFINATTHWQIVDGNLPKVLCAINDEQPSERYTGFFVQHPVITGNFHWFIGQQWNVQRAQAALLTFRINPSQMSEVAVRRAADHLAADVTKFGSTIRKCNDFSGTNESAACF